MNWQYQRKKRAQNKAAKDEEEDEGEEVEVSAVIVKKRLPSLHAQWPVLQLQQAKDREGGDADDSEDATVSFT